jgi:hypothetical protein
MDCGLPAGPAAAASKQRHVQNSFAARKDYAKMIQQKLFASTARARTAMHQGWRMNSKPAAP